MTIKTHWDEEDRSEWERYAGIVIKDNKILLVHRIREGKGYYVFPGGHRRQKETGEDAVVREVFEETGIIVDKPELVFEFEGFPDNSRHYYYKCTWKKGNKPRITGEEKDADPKINFYEPVWVNLDVIRSLNILPENAKEWVVKNAIMGF